MIIDFIVKYKLSGCPEKHDEIFGVLCQYCEQHDKNIQFKTHNGCVIINSSKLDIDTINFLNDAIDNINHK